MKRVSYLKLVPRRFTPDSEIVSIGSNQYTTQWIDVEPEAVYQDRGGTSPTDLGAFTWDEATKTLTFTTTVAPDEDIFIDYPLRFCTGEVEYVQDDPVTPSGDVVSWVPRMASHPAVLESASNMLNGVLSTSSTSVSLDNGDYSLNKYLTKYDNYKNKPVIIYGLLGSTYIKLAFGFTTKVSAGKKVSFAIKTSTKLLSDTASLGNRDKYLVYNTTDFPSLESSMVNKPIPVQYGYLTEITSCEVWNQSSVVGSATYTTPAYRDDFRFLVRMPYIGSMTYLCGIVDDPWSRTSLETCTVSYVGTETYQGLITVQRYDVQAGYIAYFVPGDINMFYSPGPTLASARVAFVDYASSQILLKTSVTNLNLAGIHLSVFRYYPEVSGPSTIYAHLDPCSVYALTTFPNAQFQYELTDSGQYLVKYVYTSVPTFNIFKDSDHFVVLKSKPIGHADFVKKYIESTGLSVDTTSFTQAQTDADTDVLMTVNLGDKLQTTHEVVENVSTSCNGILYFDTSTEKYKYKIVNSSLAGTDWYISSNDILEPDLIPDINYEDTASTVRMIHPITKDTSFIPDMNKYETNSFSRVLNSEDKTKQIDHYLTDSSTVIGYKSETYNTPMVNYRFTVMADNFINVDIGDIVQIENVGGRLLSIGDTIRLLIVSRRRSVEKIEMVGYDFSKIP